MKVVWTSEAISEIEAIIDYIAVDNPNAAFALADQIITRVEKHLPTIPNSGRPGRVKATREIIVHASYIVACRVTDTAIEILTVRHAARLWPESF